MSETPIAPRQTGGQLHDVLAHLGAEALMAALPGIADETLAPRSQDDRSATYAHKIEKAEGRIDWRRSAVEIDRQVRAFNPWPVAFTSFDGDPLRVWETEVLTGDTERAVPGTVVQSSKDGVDVATGEGLLRITKLQPAGKRMMSAAEFGNARDLGGAVLGA